MTVNFFKVDGKLVADMNAKNEIEAIASDVAMMSGLTMKEAYAEISDFVDELVSKRLSEENMELRKLASMFLDVPCICDECKHSKDNGKACEIYERMKELRIEASE